MPHETAYTFRPFQLVSLFPVRGRVAFQPPEKKKKTKKLVSASGEEKNPRDSHEKNLMVKKKIAKFT